MQTEQGRRPQKTRGREILEWALTLAAAVGLALIIRTFVFSPFIVYGHSMDDTLADKEVMFATKYDYIIGEPQRFDVVICRYPDRAEHFVKRVVGLPGDTVAVQDGYLYVNGRRYEETYIAHRPNYNAAPYTLQDGEYFVLGDNRSNSNDSHLIGPIRRDQIIAHVRSVVLPLKQMRGVE